MKTTKLAVILTSAALGLCVAAHAQTADAEPTNPASESPPATQQTQPEESFRLAPPAAESGRRPEGEASNGLRLNFRNVPLEMVLRHMSEAAGFIIVLETEVRGRVDVWSNQPLTNDEAVELLNTVLNRNGYAAIQNGRILRIVDREDARRDAGLPVQSGNDPDAIPRSEQMITQVIPVRYANATQMVRDLQPLLPDHANLTANQSGNALVLTDTQSSIRRMVEIVRALDTSISAISAIRVFPLQYADATTLATSVRDLFAPPTTGGGRGSDDRRAQFMNRFAGGGGPPGGGGRPGGEQGRGQDGGTSEALTAASRVVAVADERTNSLVVSAPEEMVPVIEELVREIDVNVDDITELRVFPLRYSDPQEIATMLTSLFPDPASTSGNRGQSRWGGGRPPTATAAIGDGTSRINRETRVLVVPDSRTRSVVVSTGRQQMEQIAAMIAQIDSNPAGDQKVQVYTLENADVQSVEAVLRELFDGQTGTRPRTTTTGRQGTTTNTRQDPWQNQGFGQGFGGQGFQGTGGGQRPGTGGRTIR